MGLGPGWISLTYVLRGGGYGVGSLTAGRLLERGPWRVVVAAAHVALALLVGLNASAVLGGATVALQPLVGFVGAVGPVELTTLLAEERPASAGTAMALNGALSNLGAAVGAASGGALLAVGGPGALGLGLPVFALGAALIVRRSGDAAGGRAKPRTRNREAAPG